MTSYSEITDFLEENSGFLGNSCYLSNNRFAYYFDRSLQGDEVYLQQETKHMNFVPTYDKWCLFCNDKNAKYRCTGCKTIYFCDKKCQKKAWVIHKNHCSRNQFILCCACGNNDIKIKCKDCPVMYCSKDCKNSFEEMHKDYDCDNFKKLYKK